MCVHVCVCVGGGGTEKGFILNMIWLLTFVQHDDTARKNTDAPIKRSDCAVVFTQAACVRARVLGCNLLSRGYTCASAVSSKHMC
jgi:hypothetical protein